MIVYFFALETDPTSQWRAAGLCGFLHFMPVSVCVLFCTLNNKEAPHFIFDRFASLPDLQAEVAELQL